MKLSFKKGFMSIASGLLSAVALLTIAGSASAAPVYYVPGEPLPSIPNPVFNTYTNVPYGIGDESDFVRLRPSDGDPTAAGQANALWTDQLDETCAVGSKYDVRTYLHNGADDDLNDNGNGSAVAHGTKIALSAPINTTSNGFTFSSTISADNAATVNDSGRLNCAGNVQLKLVANTVKVYTRNLGWNGLSDGAVNGTTSVGSHVLGSGDVWGCWDERIVVVYTVVVEEAPEPPVYTCDLLAISLVSDRKYNFTASATGQNGATVKEYRYDFGDDSEVVVISDDSVEHTYAADGTYNAVMSVVFNLPNGQTATATSDACAKTVTVDTESPIYICDELKIKFVKNRTYRFEVLATAENGATIKGYEYNFADGSDVLVTDKNSVEHSYAKDGKYAPTVKVVFDVNGEEKKVSGDNCSQNLTVDAEKPMCEVPGKEHLPKGDKNCYAPCELPNKTHLPKNSPDCKEVKGVTTTLPATGAGSIAGIMAGVTAAGTALHRKMSLRRNK